MPPWVAEELFRARRELRSPDTGAVYAALPVRPGVWLLSVCPDADPLRHAYVNTLGGDMIQPTAQAFGSADEVVDAISLCEASLLGRAPVARSARAMTAETAARYGIRHRGGGGLVQQPPPVTSADAVSVGSVDAVVEGGVR